MGGPPDDGFNVEKPGRRQGWPEHEGMDQVIGEMPDSLPFGDVRQVCLQDTRQGETLGQGPAAQPVCASLRHGLFPRCALPCAGW
jgi:hypothetical protein